MVLTERKSPNFKIKVFDKCQPYQCKNLVLTPPKDTPNDLSVVIKEGKKQIKTTFWTNNMHDLCIENPLRRAENPADVIPGQPLCGYPTVELVNDSGTPTEFTSSVTTDEVTGENTISVETDNCDRKDTSTSVKLRGYKLIAGKEAGEAFSKPFKIKFLNGVSCDEKPSFTFFPEDLEVEIPKSGIATLTAVGEDPDGPLSEIKVEVGAASEFVTYSTNLGTGKVKFKVDFSAIQKEVNVVISV